MCIYMYTYIYIYIYIYISATPRADVITDIILRRTMGSGYTGED